MWYDDGRTNSSVLHIYDASADSEITANYASDNGAALQDIPVYNGLDYNHSLSLDVVSDCNADMGGTAYDDSCDHLFWW